MLNYNGEKCISCGREFADGDDIVVCPECGTPYHRECYQKEGECINNTLHELGQPWKPSSESKSDAEKLRCPRCGSENEPGSAFCSHCGVPLESEQQSGSSQSAYGGSYGQRGYGQGGYGQGSQQTFGGQGYGNPFGGFGMGASLDPFEYYCRSAGVDPNEQIDGVGIREYFKYIRSNAMYFIQKFFRFSKEGIKSSFNIPAFLFPHIYFFFRKLYPQAIIYLTLSLVTNIFTNWVLLSAVSGSVSSYSEIYAILSEKMNQPVYFWSLTIVCLVWLASHVISGIFANYWYYKKAKRDVMEITSEPAELSMKEDMYYRRGGTSFLYAVMAYMLASVGVNLILTFIR